MDSGWEVGEVHSGWGEGGVHWRGEGRHLGWEALEGDWRVEGRGSQFWMGGGFQLGTRGRCIWAQKGGVHSDSRGREGAFRLQRQGRCIPAERLGRCIGGWGAGVHGGFRGGMGAWEQGAHASGLGRGGGVIGPERRRGREASMASRAGGRGRIPSGWDGGGGAHLGWDGREVHLGSEAGDLDWRFGKGGSGMNLCT